MFQESVPGDPRPSGTASVVQYFQGVKVPSLGRRSLLRGHCYQIVGRCIAIPLSMQGPAVFELHVVRLLS